MGVYLRDMEKPKSCGECKFFCGLGYGFHCYLNGKHITFIGEVEDFCPLIEIDLVRCGECKQLDHTKWCDLFLHYMNEDDFCSYGERRADCEDETDEEWYDWRDEQEYEDRWERRADEDGDRVVETASDRA